MKKLKPTVVSVDANPAIKKLLARSLEGMDVDFVTLASAEEALPYLSSRSVDLILLSIVLPGKDGLTLLAELRRSLIHRETQVVIFSSKDYVQDRVIADDLDVLEFISKPVPVKTITDIIVKYTAGGHTSDSNDTKRSS